MADADEDILPQPLLFSPLIHDSNLDTDPTDEQPDFRFLSTLSHQSLLPKRGTKDFEPNPTTSQAQTLAQSRQAMYTTLAHTRIHMPKTHIIGYYIPDERTDGRCIRINEFNSVNAKTMGVANRENRVWLYPEEGLYLVERGTVDLRWQIAKQHDDGDDEGEEGEEENTPMSLQAAYATLIGRSGLSLERYSVYANLKRLGYNTVRAPSWNCEDNMNANGHTTLLPPLNGQIAPRASSSGFTTLIHRLLAYLLVPDQTFSRPAKGPLIAPGLYRSYNDIFRALALIPYHDTNNLLPIPPPKHSKSPLRISYHVYKPTTPFAKSHPPHPDFRIAVVDARSTSVPSLFQIGELLDSMPLDELPPEKRLEQRLKHGRRNVLIAVVDGGVLSYLRLSEAGFGSIKLFEERNSKDRKGSGRGKGVRR